jgi:hypothetical protein
MLGVAKADMDFDFSGKVQSRFTLRAEDSEGNTFPKTSAGDMVQQRNLAILELSQNLTPKAGKDDLEFKYRIVGRFLYEGIYDYGPMNYRKATDDLAKNVDSIDDFKKDADLWEAYADVKKGAAFLRIGKQNLAWGETDIFRVLDNINPMDDTFGLMFEDLDDRRIPISMVKGSYTIGSFGKLASLTIEGFWSPGEIENTVYPQAPYGTPYKAPVTLPGGGFPVFINESVVEPEKDMSNSRYGARLIGVINDKYTATLARYRTYLDWGDAENVVLTVDQQFSPFTMTPAILDVERRYKPVDVTGASLNFYDDFTNSVIKAEVGYLEDVSVWIPQINTPAPDFSLGYPQFVNGKSNYKDIFKFMVGFDKDVWIRPLNRTKTFGVGVQYFGSYINDYDDRICQAVPEQYGNNSSGPFPKIKRYEQAITCIAMTSYMNGNLNPQLVSVYNPRGVWLYIPSVEYVFEPFKVPMRAKIQYGAIEGEWTSFGVFKDRDQVSLQLTVLF